ncbi:hypothetical protein N8J89_30275 [Crossiella sp. CA-258035]|uniref:hypothetical protein n=1 Tax=Crossiella sp. CA-258035 TaxID=2981138 RepID=UPI0024BCE46B|nr:hypothetical protein [Crossiella sp. CA-258035]WHT17391.1 hypothetical protein N8J89_30275 [Crossiella sp. CA-258035]
MTELSARRRALLTGATITAVLVATVVVLREDTEPAPPSPSTTVAEEPAVPRLRSVDVVAGRHFFGVLGHCRERTELRCAHTLMESEEGGITFTDLPEELRGERSRLWVEVTALGQQRLVVRGNNGPHWFSADRGRSWRKVTEDAAPVDSIPAGAQLERHCPPGTTCQPEITVLLPESGRRAELRTLPPLTEARPLPFPDRKGRWRVVGKRDGRPVVATSADQGRGWQLAELPPGGDGTLVQVSVAESGEVTFIQLMTQGGQAESATASRSTLYRQRGERWELLWQDGRREEHPRSMTSLLPRPGGQLVALDLEGRSWVLEDGARSFRQAVREEKLPANSRVQRIRTGYLLVEGTAFRHTVDGVGWTPLHSG